ncbi:hypothetical protein Tco_0776564, partial [Tanacetum coccineum]
MKWKPRILNLALLRLDIYKYGKLNGYGLGHLCSVGSCASKMMPLTPLSVNVLPVNTGWRVPLFEEISAGTYMRDLEHCCKTNIKIQ